MLNIDTSKLLDKPMNRKQFLRNAGIGIVALTGLSAAIRAIGQANIADTSTQSGGQVASSASAYGYGGSVYGGVKPRS